MSHRCQPRDLPLIEQEREVPSHLRSLPLMDRNEEHDPRRTEFESSTDASDWARRDLGELMDGVVCGAINGDAVDRECRV